MTLPRSSRHLLPALAFAALVSGCLDSQVEETTLRRGDMAFAADSLEEALAEYRLAVRQGNDAAPVLARVGHTFVALGRVDEAAHHYRLAVAEDESYRTQAVADLMRMAREAAVRGDRFQMASAVQEALTLEPAIGLDDMALPLARHYFENGEYGAALPLYQRSLKGGADSVPEVVFEVGRAYAEVGDCQNGLIFFERFREGISRGQRGEVDWHIGNCAFNLAREYRGRADASTDELQDALEMVDRVLEVGEPRSILGAAWFERGEILAALGDCEGAMESFAQVRVMEGPGGGSLVRRAQQRYDEIYFGEGLRGHRSERPCG